MKGVFLLDSSTTAFVENEKKNHFTIKSDESGSMLVETTSAAEMLDWLTVLRTTVRGVVDGYL